MDESSTTSLPKVLSLTTALDRLVLVLVDRGASMDNSALGKKKPTTQIRSDQIDVMNTTDELDSILETKTTEVLPSATF